MQWIGKSDEMDPTEWGWDVQGGKLVPLMMDKSPAPDLLLKMIGCSCSTRCITKKCSCRKSNMECTSACGHYRENMTQDPVFDEDDCDA